MYSTEAERAPDGSRWIVKVRRNTSGFRVVYQTPPSTIKKAEKLAVAWIKDRYNKGNHPE